MGLPLAGFLINRMPAHPDFVEEHAPHDLAKLASANLLGVLPEVVGSPELRIEQLADAVATLPTLPWLLHAFGLAPGSLQNR
jgi:dethiobiotin synthetase